MEKRKQISVSGEPGAGKTTAIGRLERILGYPVYNIGQYSRKLCEDMGYAFDHYEQFMQDFPDLDRAIDDSCTQASDDNINIIIDARLGWFFAPNTFKVFLTCEPQEAARRIFEEDRDQEKYASLDACRIATKRRFEDENKRFMKKYGVSNATRSQFDLVVDTTHLSEQEVVDEILKGYEAWLKEPA